MNLVRKIKISKLVEVEFTKDESEILNFINTNLYDLNPFVLNEYSQSTFFMNNINELIFDYDRKYKVIWVRYDEFFKTLEYTYRVNTKDIKYLLYNALKTIFNFDDYDVIPLQCYHYNKVESQYGLMKKQNYLQMFHIHDKNNNNINMNYIEIGYFKQLDYTKKLLLNINLNDKITI